MNWPDFAYGALIGAMTCNAIHFIFTYREANKRWKRKL